MENNNIHLGAAGLESHDTAWKDFYENKQKAAVENGASKLGSLNATSYSLDDNAKEAYERLVLAPEQSKAAAYQAGLNKANSGR